MKEITEKQFEQQVKDLAKLFGWRYYHTWRSIHSPAGFPDCVMVRPPRLIFTELKSEKGKVTEEQEDWLEILRASSRPAGITYQSDIIHSTRKYPTPEVYLWRPSDIEKIFDILQ